MDAQLSQVDVGQASDGRKAQCRGGKVVGDAEPNWEILCGTKFFVFLFPRSVIALHNSVEREREGESFRFSSLSLPALSPVPFFEKRHPRRDGCRRRICRCRSGGSKRRGQGAAAADDGSDDATAIDVDRVRSESADLDCCCCCCCSCCCCCRRLGRRSKRKPTRERGGAPLPGLAPQVGRRGRGLLPCGGRGRRPQARGRSAGQGAAARARGADGQRRRRRRRRTG